MRLLAVFRIGIFLVVLALPLATMRAAGTAATLANEQRTRVPLPSLRKSGVEFPERFDAFFRDAFGGRDRVIGWYHLLKFRVLGESPVDAVIAGRDGWLFYSSPTDGLDIRNFSGHWPHAPGDVDEWLLRQDARREAYARVGARYLIAAAPDKQSVYREQVPFRYGPYAPGVLGEIRQRLASHPDLQVLDLSDALRSRRDQDLYYKADTHWNGHGAFIAASAIADRLRQQLPAVGAIREADYDVDTAPRRIGDLVNMMGLGLPADDRMFTYRRRTPGARHVRDEPPHQVWEQPGSGLPTAVLFGDSFGASLAPVLADSFSRLHYYLSSTAGPDPSIVTREHPDVVILIVVERYLPHLARE